MSAPPRALRRLPVRGRPLLLLLFLLLPPAAGRATPASPCLAPGADCTLRELAELAGVRIGAAAQPRLIGSDPAYADVLSREFGSLTPESQMKWAALRPDRDTFAFGPADELVAFAEAGGMRVRGHTLLWADPTRIPGWVSAIGDAADLAQVLEEHIATVGQRYAGRVDAWDVVNEPLAVLGAPVLRDNVYLDLLGPDYIADAFRAARAADPGAALFLNETQVIGREKFEALYALVSGLVADGVPIDGVGLQGHYLAGFNEPAPGFVREMVEAFAGLGLRVELTEMDVAVSPTLGDLETRLALQAETVGRVLGECLAVAACEGVTFWGFTDRHTWIDDFLAPGLLPLPFDADYQRKPAYFAARQALRARALPEPGAPGLALALAIAAGCTRRVGRRQAGAWTPGMSQARRGRFLRAVSQARKDRPLFVVLALLVGGAWAAEARADTFKCESEKGRRELCEVSGRVEDVRLVKQLSSASCVKGRSFGHERNGVWVSDGCRGRFEAAVAPQQRIDCNSKDGKRRRCDVGFDQGVRKATLVRQKSDAACRQGRSWGFDRQGVWVGDGCRAEFDVVGFPVWGASLARKDEDDGSGDLLKAAGAVAGVAAIGALIAGAQSAQTPAPAPSASPPAPQASAPATELPWLDPAPSAAPSATATDPGLPWEEPQPAAPSAGSGFTPPGGAALVPEWGVGSFRGMDPSGGGELRLDVAADGGASLHAGEVSWDGQYRAGGLELGGVRYDLRQAPGGVVLRPSDGRAGEVLFRREP